eukprot:SAG11_NODE_12614_length_694_cov_1.295798_1_plen_43_part_01
MAAFGMSLDMLPEQVRASLTPLTEDGGVLKSVLEAGEGAPPSG